MNEHTIMSSATPAPSKSGGRKKKQPVPLTDEEVQQRMTAELSMIQGNCLGQIAVNHLLVNPRIPVAKEYDAYVLNSPDRGEADIQAELDVLSKSTRDLMYMCIKAQSENVIGLTQAPRLCSQALRSLELAFQDVHKCLLYKSFLRQLIEKQKKTTPPPPSLPTIEEKKEEESRE